MLCLFLFPLQATEEIKTKTSRIVNEQAGDNLTKLLSGMKSVEDLDERKRQVENLVSFTKQDYEAVNPKDITVDQFNITFENIVKSGVLLPDAIVTSLWELFMRVYADKYGGKWDIWDRREPLEKEIPLEASVFFTRHRDVLKQGLLTKQVEFFEGFTASHIEEMNIKDLMPFYLNDYMNIIINKSDFSEYKNVRTQLIRKLIASPKFQELMTEYFNGKVNINSIDDAQISFLGELFSKKNEHKIDWIDNANIINDMLGNRFISIKLTKKSKDYLEDDLLSEWVVEPLKQALKGDVDHRVFEELNRINAVELDEISQVIVFQLSSYLRNNIFTINDKNNYYVFEKLIQFLVRLNVNNLEFTNYCFMSYLLNDYKNINSILNHVDKSNVYKNFVLKNIFPNIGINGSQVKDLKKLMGSSQIQESLQKEEWLALGIKSVVDRNEILNSNYSSMKKITDLYTNDTIKKFSEMIFSDLPGLQLNTKYTTHVYSNHISKIIFNSDGYIKNEFGKVDVFLPQEGGKFVRGKPLVLKAGDYIKTSETPEKSKGVLVTKDIPIGYNIYLPEGEIKGVIVHVYGGFQTKDRLERLNKPIDLLDSLDTYLMNRGIAVVKLNLLNFLELNNFQLSMPQDIHAKLHASIHQFFQNLRNNDLQSPLYGIIPQTAKIYLYGASFGGRTALRHAELYPDSFDGYISHDGTLSMKAVNLSDIPIASSGNRFPSWSKAWLDPMGLEKISYIIKPVLLLHNFDDNNVNIRVSLDFYDAALKSGKGNLVHLLITRRGNPIPMKIAKNKETLKDLVNKGHFPTEDEQAFKTYTDTIADFILYGLHPLRSRSQWMAHQYEIYANKNYRSADVIEKFTSYAYRLYKQRYIRPVHGMVGEGIESTVSDLPPMPGTELTREEAKKRELSQKALSKEELTSLPTKEQAEEFAVQKQQQEEKENFDHDWEMIYEPLYIVLFQMESDKVDTYLKKLITNQSIENALLQQLPLFFNYLIEHEDFKFLDQLSVRDFALNTTLQIKYRKFLEYGAGPLQKYLRDNLILANADMIKTVVTDWKNGGNNLTTTDLKSIHIAKENLWERIQEDKRHIVAISHEMAKVPSYKPERNIDDIFKILTHKDAPYDQKNYMEILQFVSRVLENKPQFYRDQTLGMIKERYKATMETFKDCVQSSLDCRLNYASALASLGILNEDIKSIEEARLLLARDVDMLLPLFQSFHVLFSSEQQNNIKLFIDEAVSTDLLEKKINSLDEVVQDIKANSLEDKQDELQMIAKLLSQITGIMTKQDRVILINTAKKRYEDMVNTLEKCVENSNCATNHLQALAALSILDGNRDNMKKIIRYEIGESNLTKRRLRFRYKEIVIPESILKLPELEEIFDQVMDESK